MGIFDKLFKSKKMKYEILSNGKHQIGAEDLCCLLFISVYY